MYVVYDIEGYSKDVVLVFNEDPREDYGFAVAARLKNLRIPGPKGDMEFRCEEVLDSEGWKEAIHREWSILTIVSRVEDSEPEDFDGCDSDQRV